TLFRGALTSVSTVIFMHASMSLMCRYRLSVERHGRKSTPFSRRMKKKLLAKCPATPVAPGMWQSRQQTPWTSACADQRDQRIRFQETFFQQFKPRPLAIPMALVERTREAVVP